MLNPSLLCITRIWEILLLQYTVAFYIFILYVYNYIISTKPALS